MNEQKKGATGAKREKKPTGAKKSTVKVEGLDNLGEAFKAQAKKAYDDMTTAEKRAHTRAINKEKKEAAAQAAKIAEEAEEAKKAAAQAAAKAKEDVKQKSENKVAKPTTEQDHPVVIVVDDRLDSLAGACTVLYLQTVLPRTRVEYRSRSFRGEVIKGARHVHLGFPHRGEDGIVGHIGSGGRFRNEFDVAVTRFGNDDQKAAGGVLARVVAKFHEADRGGTVENHQFTADEAFVGVWHYMRVIGSKWLLGQFGPVFQVYFAKALRVAEAERVASEVSLSDSGEGGVIRGRVPQEVRERVMEVLFSAEHGLGFVIREDDRAGTVGSIIINPAQSRDVLKEVERTILTLLEAHGEERGVWRPLARPEGTVWVSNRDFKTKIPATEALKVLDACYT